jgi:Na+-translocating ferredoxin:NAD+ oxidoreductase subunit B
VCPHDAVRRAQLSGELDGAYLYTINCEHCTGCAQCVRECNQHGSKSMFLIIRPDLCLGCNDCSIAHICKTGAVERVPIYPVNDCRGELRPDQDNNHPIGTSPIQDNST